MDKRRFIISYFVAALLFFTVPYLFDNMEPSQSVSFMVGFNNKVAFGLLVLFGIIFFSYGLLDKVVPNCWKVKKEFKVDKLLLYTSIIVFILIAANGAILNEYLGFAEGTYFMHHVYVVEHGAQLYKDIYEECCRFCY